MNIHKGRPKITKYDETIRTLRINYCLGSRRILQELLDRGIFLSRGTIERRIKEIDQEYLASREA